MPQLNPHHNITYNGYKELTVHIQFNIMHQKQNQYKRICALYPQTNSVS